MSNDERDTAIAEDYATHSAAWVAAKWGLSIPAVRRIAAARNVKKGIVQVLSYEEKVVDETHRLLGLRLYFFRNEKKGHSRKTASDFLCWSEKKLANVETGRTLLSLHDLQSISKYIGISIIELLRDYDTPNT